MSIVTEVPNYATLQGFFYQPLPLPNPTPLSRKARMREVGLPIMTIGVKAFEAIFKL